MSDLALPKGAEFVDRRFGGRWTRTQTLKNWAIRAAIQALLGVVDNTPRRVLVALGAALGRGTRAVSGLLRRQAREHAALGLSASHARVARECFPNAGRSLALSALLRRDGVRASEYVSMSEASRDCLRRALSMGRGALVVSAHLGPFEMIPVRLVEAGFAPAIVVRESYDPELDRVVDHHRRLHGVDVIHRGRAGAAVRIVRALRSGRPVGVLPDLGGRGLSTLPVRFLGRTVAFPIGAQQLARRTGAPMLLGTLCRTPSADGEPPFELVVEDIPGTSHSAGLGEERSLAELTRRVASAVERAIERAPQDWLWMAAPQVAIAADSDTPLFSEIIRQSGSSRA